MTIMMVPDFRLKTPNPNPSLITNAMWWLWERMHELEPVQGELAGIYANKSGFHNTGNANEQNWPGNYSIRDVPNRRGEWWRTKASAIDWSFKDAQNGDYKTIKIYSNRLYNSGKDPNDPRLDMVLYEFFGQCDNDTQVEGWNEYRDENASSDPSHLWHIHESILRDKCGDFWAMWALYTVLAGMTVAQWRASLTQTTAAATEEDMWCKKTDKNDYVVQLQDRLVEVGIPVGPADPNTGVVEPIDPADPYKHNDGEYGDWTKRAVASLKAVAGDTGEAFGALQDRALRKLEKAKGGAISLEGATLKFPATSLSVSGTLTAGGTVTIPAGSVQAKAGS